MPPKAKFTKEEVVSAAVEIVKEGGLDALTARTLGERLGSSPRPVFTLFESMSEVQECVKAAAFGLYSEYVAEGLNEELPFKGVGKAYVRFAAEQPKFFQLLFMCEREKIPDSDNVLGLIDGNSEKILSSIMSSYGFNRELSYKLYKYMWIYSHGIAVLLATRVCYFTAEAISEMLTEACVGMIYKIKSEGKL